VKQAPFAEAESGATGLELLLPLTLKWAEEAGQSLSFALGRITCEAARVLNVDAGHLAPGQAADICVFDPERYWRVGADTLRSLGKNTPYRGIELKGKVRYTLVGGEVVYQC
jgi:dihydroorotase